MREVNFIFWLSEASKLILTFHSAQLLKPMMLRRLENDLEAIDRPFNSYTHADCLHVAKNLLVYGWGRWDDILKRGKQEHKLTTADVETLARVLLIYALQQNEGDEHIRSFLYELVSGPQLSEEDKKHIDAFDEGFKQYFNSHINNFLQRVHLLHYLRHEVIGKHEEKVLSGALARKIPIPMPVTDDNPPAYWWDIECDRSLLVGIFKHGFEKFNLMRNDPCLVFLEHCGPPDQALITAEMNDEEM
jgi:hypothetical protein